MNSKVVEELLSLGIFLASIMVILSLCITGVIPLEEEIFFLLNAVILAVCSVTSYSVFGLLVPIVAIVVNNLYIGLDGWVVSEKFIYMIILYITTSGITSVIWNKSSNDDYIGLLQIHLGMVSICCILWCLYIIAIVTKIPNMNSVSDVALYMCRCILLNVIHTMFINKPLTNYMNNMKRVNDTQ